MGVQDSRNRHISDTGWLCLKRKMGYNQMENIHFEMDIFYRKEWKYHFFQNKSLLLKNYFGLTNQEKII